MKDVTKYWLDISEYDLDTARGLIQLERYIYAVFMCHQAIEKLLKAIITVHQDDPPPFTHNLAILTEKSGISTKFTEIQIQFIDQLNPYNLQARYPNYKLKIYTQTTSEIANDILKKTEDLFQWLRQWIR